MKKFRILLTLLNRADCCLQGKTKPHTPAELRRRKLEFREDKILRLVEQNPHDVPPAHWLIPDVCMHGMETYEARQEKFLRERPLSRKYRINNSYNTLRAKNLLNSLQKEMY